MSDEPHYDIMGLYGDNYPGATKVFTAGHSEVFHADKHCPRLTATATDDYSDEPTVFLRAYTLRKVMTHWGDPVKPCSQCTQDIETTAEVAVEHDGVHEAELRYFEPGEKRVTTTYRQTPGGEVEVKDQTKVIE